MGEGFAQQTEHRLPSRKIVVIAKLEAISALAERIEDEHCFDIKEIVRWPVAGAKVVCAQKDNLASLF